MGERGPKKKKEETGKRKQRDTRGRKTRVAVGPECPMERRQEGLKGRRSIIFRGIGGGDNKVSCGQGHESLLSTS